MQLRKVAVKRHMHRPEQDPQWVLEVVGEAMFHEFSTMFCDSGDGLGQHPVAIIEWADGTVEAAMLFQIQFIKEDKNG